MTTVTVWILVVTFSGPYKAAMVNIPNEFKTIESCQKSGEVFDNFRRGTYKYHCIPVEKERE